MSSCGHREIWSSFRFGEVFRDIDLAMLDRAYASGLPDASADCEHRFEDGRLGCLTYTFAPLAEPGGGVRGLIVSVRDTTEQMLAHREFLRSAAALRTLNERLVLSSIREQEHAEAEAAQRAQLNALLEKLKEGVLIAEPGGRVADAQPTPRAPSWASVRRAEHGRRARVARGS